MPLESLLGDGWQVVPYFYNPNIQPREEYDRRLDVWRAFLDELGLSSVVGPYDSGPWDEKVGSLGGPYPLVPGMPDYQTNQKARLKRCRACYGLRLESAASLAGEAGCRYLDTTLTISPYQFTHEVLDALGSAAALLGKESLGNDWHGRYPLSVQRSRALGMYRQNYCGCRFSEQEARIERQARRREERGEMRGERGELGGEGESWERRVVCEATWVNQC